MAAALTESASDVAVLADFGGSQRGGAIAVPSNATNRHDVAAMDLALRVAWGSGRPMRVLTSDTEPFELPVTSETITGPLTDPTFLLEATAGSSLVITGVGRAGTPQIFGPLRGQLLDRREQAMVAVRAGRDRVAAWVPGA